MRRGLALFVGLGCALFVALHGTPVLADDGTPRGRVPLGKPPAPRQVPVPDVRGIDEAAAQRALTEGGLRVAGVERVSVARLEAELGRRYAVGTVVQQAPAPSTDDRPSWLARGGPVWLRVAAPNDQDVASPRTPVPVQPREPVYPTGPGRSANPPPPPPYDYGRVEQQPSLAQPPYVQPPAVQPPGPQPPLVAPPFADPQATETFFAADIRSNVALPCERRQERWHVRPVVGAAFWLGDDAGDVDLYAGVDAGRTFSNCFGVDAFYRYAGGVFDRDVTGGLLEDAGSFQFIGLKGTWNTSLGTDGHLFFWAGLGVAYYWSSELRVDDEGIAGFVELGLGYALTDGVRMRLGVNIHGMDSDAGRFLATNDTSARLLWIVAPTLAVELDL